MKVRSRVLPSLSFLLCECAGEERMLCANPSRMCVTILFVLRNIISNKSCTFSVTTWHSSFGCSLFSCWFCFCYSMLSAHFISQSWDICTCCCFYLFLWSSESLPPPSASLRLPRPLRPPRSGAHMIFISSLKLSRHRQCSENRKWFFFGWSLLLAAFTEWIHCALAHPSPNEIYW